MITRAPRPTSPWHILDHRFLLECEGRPGVWFERPLRPGSRVALGAEHYQVVAAPEWCSELWIAPAGPPAWLEIAKYGLHRLECELLLGIRRRGWLRTEVYDVMQWRHLGFWRESCDQFRLLTRRTGRA